EEVDAALSQNLSALMWEGPEADLTLTANAQPALMAVSLAALRVLEAEAGLDLARDAAYVAGHSLGEYSALCAAGAFTLGDAATPCRGPCRPARAPWRRCSGSNSRPPRRRPRKPLRARSARPPTTMAAGRWSSPARGRRSSAPARSPRPRGPAAP